MAYRDAAISEKVLSSRLDAVRTAQQRTTSVLAFALTLSVVIVVATYNAYLSWNRHFALSLNEYGAREVAAAAPAASTTLTSDVTKNAHEYALRNWVESRFVSIPLIGMKVAVDDVAVLGGLSLTLLYLVYRYVSRNQRRVVLELLEDTSSSASVETKALVYHSIVAYHVLSDLQGHLPLRPRTTGGVKADRTGNVKLGFIALLYFPIVAQVAVIACDILSLVYFDAPFRLPHHPLKEHLHETDWVIVFAYLACGMLSVALALYFANEILDDEVDMSSMLAQYGDDLKRR